MTSNDEPQANATNATETSRVAAAGERARETASAAKAKAAEAYDSARERTSAAFDSAKERAGAAYDSARQTASSAGRATADGIDANPFGALIGGLAIGALIAAVLPRTRREEELLGGAGRRIADTAREAARAAREAGAEKLGDLGLSTDNARQKLGELADNAGQAVRVSAGAAAQTLKDGARPN